LPLHFAIGTFRSFSIGESRSAFTLRFAIGVSDHTALRRAALAKTTHFHNGNFSSCRALPRNLSMTMRFVQTIFCSRCIASFRKAVRGCGAWLDLERSTRKSTVVEWKLP
jgi:hypothetical protein